MLVDELSRSSPELVALWDEREVAALGSGTERVLRAGRDITFDLSTLPCPATSICT